MIAADYLVTGLPRCRSAWLAAVLSTPEIPCVHAPDDVEWPIVYRHGLSDPCAASLHPRATLDAMAGKPVVVIVRNEEEAWQSFRALGRRGGLTIKDRGLWGRWAKNLHQFAAASRAHIVSYNDLSDAKIVQDLAAHLGVSVSLSYVKHMDLLKIEQHPKCLQFALSRSK